jgi:hypothetical protein
VADTVYVIAQCIDLGLQRCHGLDNLIACVKLHFETKLHEAVVNVLAHAGELCVEGGLHAGELRIHVLSQQGQFAIDGIQGFLLCGNPVIRGQLFHGGFPLSASHHCLPFSRNGP